MAGVSQEVMVKLASYSEEATEEMADTFLLARRDTFKTMEKVMLTIKVHNKNKSGMPRSMPLFSFYIYQYHITHLCTLGLYRWCPKALKQKHRKLCGDILVKRCKSCVIGCRKGHLPDCIAVVFNCSIASAHIGAHLLDYILNCWHLCY